MRGRRVVGLGAAKSAAVAGAAIAVAFAAAIAGSAVVVATRPRADRSYGPTKTISLSVYPEPASPLVVCLGTTLTVKATLSGREYGVGIYFRVRAKGTTNGWEEFKSPEPTDPNGEAIVTFETAPPTAAAGAIPGTIEFQATTKGKQGYGRPSNIVEVSVVRVDLDVFNEHGGPELAEGDEETPGSYVLVNRDDDDGANGQDNSNGVIDGDSDKLDMAKVRLQVEPHDVADLAVRLDAPAADRAHVRVFNELGTEVAVWPDEIAMARFGAGAINYHVEGLSSGSATFTLSVISNDTTLCTDTVKVTVVPYFAQFNAWGAWPGGQAETSLNSTEAISSSNLGLSGNVKWAVDHGGTTASVVSHTPPTGERWSQVVVRCDNASPDNTFTRAVEIKAYDTGPNTKLAAVRRTVFRVSWRDPNTAAALDADNQLRFPLQTGADTARCEFNWDGERGAGAIAAKVECTAVFEPTGIDWPARGVSFEFGAGAEGSRFQCRAYRERRGAYGQQRFLLDAYRNHFYQADWIVNGEADAVDCQRPTANKPDKLFRIDAPGVDAVSFKQYYMRYDFRDLLQWHNGSAWTRCSPHSSWFVNITGELPNCAKGTPSGHGKGGTTEKAPNTKPVATLGPDQAVEAGATVQLDGSGSTDPDGDRLEYEWRQTAGPAVTLSLEQSRVRPTFTAPLVAAPTDLVFELIVADGTQDLGRFSPGNSSSDPATVTVTVSPAP